MTAQGHPRAIFGRAIENGNLVIAEATARELGRLSLEEALQLVLLYAAYEPAKVERAALRWFGRYLSEREPGLLRAQIALAALGELRGGSEAAGGILVNLVDSRAAVS